MSTIITWLNNLGFNMPELSWFKYVLASVILLVVLDAFLNLLFAGIHTLISGGKR